MERDIIDQGDGVKMSKKLGDTRLKIKVNSSWIVKIKGQIYIWSRITLFFKDVKDVRSQDVG